MLSDENAKKLNLNGLYKCEPDAKYRGSLYSDNLFWCFNWTFNVVIRDGHYYMVDTYFDDQYIRLTDKNIDDFKLLFDWNEVKKISEREAEYYRDHHRVAIDSGGWSMPKFFVNVDAKRCKDLVLEDIDNRITSMERELGTLERRREGIINGEYDLDWHI